MARHIPCSWFVQALVYPGSGLSRLWFIQAPVCPGSGLIVNVFYTSTALVTSHLSLSGLLCAMPSCC